jgi:hypothetical protein
MSDGLKAMRDLAPLMPLSVRPPRERPDRDILAVVGRSSYVGFIGFGRVRHAVVQARRLLR